MRQQILLNIRKCIVVFLIENQKWNIYIKYLNSIKIMRKIFKMSSGKELTYATYTSILSQVYENINKLNLQNACLIRSAVGMLYLIGYKNNFSLNIGVKINPFVSHAWLSLDNKPIFESEEIRDYKIILQV